MISETTKNVKTGRTSTEFSLLADWNVLSLEDLRAAETTAAARGLELEQVLLRDHRVPKRTMLKALSEHYGCPGAEYDERMPIPPELFPALDGERLSFSKWFPIARDNGLVVIAARDPRDPAVIEEVKRSIPAEQYEFRVALEEDIQWYILDFLHAKPGALIGTERTGLAFWRNTMAHWRTKLACYRNDLAQGRTDLAVLRWGLGIVALSDVLLRTHPAGPAGSFYGVMLAAGAGLALFGLKGYLRVRKTRMRAPGHHTLVEVTSATMLFVENYHDREACTLEKRSGATMLARLGDCIGGYSSILYPSPSSRERTHLARERNILAAQRTVAATYRTIYARARTGLAFIRTGVSFTSLGFGLLQYFGVGVMSLFDVLLIASGALMAVDGMLWYLPVRREQAEIPRCPVPMQGLR